MKTNVFIDDDIKPTVKLSVLFPFIGFLLHVCNFKNSITGCWQTMQLADVSVNMESSKKCLEDV